MSSERKREKAGHHQDGGVGRRTTASGGVSRRELLGGLISAGGALALAQLGGTGCSSGQGSRADGGASEETRISILLENTVSGSAAAASQLAAENGIAWLVESAGRRVLVDSGLSDLFVKNATVMGIDLASVEAVVLSHIHLDHWAGLRHFLEKNSTAKVYLHEDARDYEYYYGQGRSGYHGIPDAFIEQHGKRLEFFRHAELRQVATGIYVVSAFEQRFPPPKNVNLFKKRRGTQVFEVDDLRHDVALLVARQQDMVLVSPCSHNGIVNVVERAVTVYRDQLTGNPALGSKPVAEVPVRAVVGGFHFVDPISLMGPGEQVLVETPEYIASVATALDKGYSIQRIYTCHCTGHQGYAYLASSLGQKLVYSATGDVLVL